MLKNLVAKLAGRILRKKLNLQEGTMDENKKWYKSKNVWTGIITAAVGAYELIDVNVGPQIGFNLPNIPEWLFIILGTLGIYTRVSATKKIG